MRYPRFLILPNKNKIKFTYLLCAHSKYFLDFMFFSELC